MEALYVEEQANYEKEVQEQAEYEELVSEELKGAFVETEDGRYELQIPEDFETTLTEEQILELQTNLNKTYEMLDNGEIAVDEETGEYYTPGEDDVFKLQGRSTKFIKNLYYDIIVGYKSCGWFCLKPVYIKLWHGFEMELSVKDSLLIGISTLLQATAATVLALPQIISFFSKWGPKLKSFLGSNGILASVIVQALGALGISLKVANVLNNIVDVLLQVFKFASIAITTIKLIITALTAGIGNILWELGGLLLHKLFLFPALFMVYHAIASGGSRLSLRNYVHFSTSG